MSLPSLKFVLNFDVNAITYIKYNFCLKLAVYVSRVTTQVHFENQLVCLLSF